MNYFIFAQAGFIAFERIWSIVHTNLLLIIKTKKMSNVLRHVLINFFFMPLKNQPGFPSSAQYAYQQVWGTLEA